MRLVINKLSQVFSAVPAESAQMGLPLPNMRLRILLRVAKTGRSGRQKRKVWLVLPYPAS